MEGGRDKRDTGGDVEDAAQSKTYEGTKPSTTYAS